MFFDLFLWFIFGFYLTFLLGVSFRFLIQIIMYTILLWITPQIPFFCFLSNLNKGLRFSSGYLFFTHDFPLYGWLFFFFGCVFFVFCSWRLPCVFFRCWSGALWSLLFLLLPQAEIAGNQQSVPLLEASYHAVFSLQIVF